MRAVIVTVATAVASASLLLTACASGGSWWSLFNVFFLLLGAVPMTFGSHETTSIVANAADFAEAIMAFSVFALPTVLHRTDELSGLGLFLVYCSNVCAGAALYMLYRIQKDAAW